MGLSGLRWRHSHGPQARFQLLHMVIGMYVRLVRMAGGGKLHPPNAVQQCTGSADGLVISLQMFQGSRLHSQQPWWLIHGAVTCTVPLPVSE